MLSGLRQHGFTLIELIVVIAVIGVLAALLLPSFKRMKGSARSTVCKSNLRQIGLSLRLYVEDFEKYPPYHAQELTNGVPDGEWDVQLLRYHGGQKSTFDCPAREVKRAWADGFTTGITGVYERAYWGFHNWSYGYNVMGAMVGWLGDAEASEKSLGLSGEVGEPAVPESRVLVPADMIAIGDGGRTEIEGFGYPGSVHIKHTDRRPNAVFCDGHVESSDTERIPKNSLGGLFVPTDAHAKRWNRDNQPHPETWNSWARYGP